MCALKASSNAIESPRKILLLSGSLAQLGEMSCFLRSRGAHGQRPSGRPRSMREGAELRRAPQARSGAGGEVAGGGGSGAIHRAARDHRIDHPVVLEEYREAAVVPARDRRLLLRAPTD